MGIPQAIDPNTKDFVFSHFARIQVEVDLLHTLHQKLLIEGESYSFKVLVTYESIPKLCMHCHIIGHLMGECRSLKKIKGKASKYVILKDTVPKNSSKKPQTLMHKPSNQ